MDDSQQKALFGRLEETVNAWLGQFSDAHRGLVDQSSKIKDMLEMLTAGIGRHREGAKELAQKAMSDLKTLRDALGAQEESGRRIAELEGALAKAKADADELRQHQPNIEKDLANAREAAEKAEHRALEMDRLRSELQTRADELFAALEKADANEKALTLDLEVTLGDLAKAREERDALSASKQEAEQLDRLLAAERQRSGELEQKLREETTKKAKSALAQQLTEALRECETAQEEVQKLKAELAEGRATRKDPPAAAPPEPKEEAPPRRRKGAKGKGEPKRSLAEVLVEAGVVTQGQIDDVLENERVTPQRHVGVILIERGLASEADIAQAISSFCDADYVRLDNTKYDAEAVRLLSVRLAKLHICLPIRVDGNKVVLAMANPLDLVAIEDIERTTNLTVQPVVAVPSEILEAIERCYVEDTKIEGGD